MEKLSLKQVLKNEMGLFLSSCLNCKFYTSDICAIDARLKRDTCGNNWRPNSRFENDFKMDA